MEHEAHLVAGAPVMGLPDTWCDAMDTLMDTLTDTRCSFAAP